MCGCGRTSWCAPAGTSIGPKWSKKTNGPTARRFAEGRSRRTTKPPPRSLASGARLCNCVTDSLLRAGSGQCRRRLKSSAALCPGSDLEPLMSLKCGIVGLPNVGKSTLFNALTKAGIAAENYPFCTIEPNVGVVELPDPRLDAAGGDRQARAHRPGDRRVRRHRRPGRRRVARARGSATSSSPTSARPTRSSTSCAASTTRTSIHVAGKVDPVADIEVIQTELCLADLATVEKSLARYSKVAKAGNDKEARSAGRRAREVPGGARRGAAGARAGVQQGGAGGAAAAVPDHRQAGDVRRQRRRGRLREQPLPRPAARRTPRASTRRSSPSAPRPRPSSPTWATRTGRCSSPRWGRTEPGLRG